MQSVRQIIMAQHVTHAPNDQQQLAPLLAQIKASTGRQVREVSADAS